MRLSPNQLVQTLGPQYEGLELGIGDSLLIKALSHTTSRDVSIIKADYVAKGDLGTVAQESRQNQKLLFGQKTASLTVPTVFATLREIASSTGHSTMKRKVDKISGLLVRCQGDEAKYLIRSLGGKLRIGLAEQTVLAALAHASILHRESIADKEQGKRSHSETERAEQLLKAVEIIKSVYNQLPNYDIIIPALLEHGVMALEEKCKLTPGIPVKPMLAHPTRSITEVLNRFEKCTFTCEYKYDGERAQVHFFDGQLRVYSRNAENMSSRYPDIIEKMSKATLETTSNFILDCEAVAWDLQKHQILPFQVLSTRKRKDVKEADIVVQVRIFAFDLLYLNGECLLQMPLKERRTRMHAAFREVEDNFGFAVSMDGQTIEEIQAFLDHSVHDNCEGLMVKVLDGPEASYEPSKRSRNWLKIKKDYLDGVGDSLDLVVIGAYYGRGKRKDVYGGYLLACYDPGTEQVEAICKIGTGFSDEDLKQHYEELKPHIIAVPRPYYRVSSSVRPDVWFDTKKIWEVKAADLSLSPVYSAAQGQVDDSDKGISLRFPRFIRQREDKTYDECTSSDRIANMYRQQFAHQQQQQQQQQRRTARSDESSDGEEA
ncbi:ATP dependent DNA ligase domain-containing protein [Syncephalis pseudoplumigaleata]|uniref:DNA ligase n=1 Tax=Syncephalis pseudoplumigaleata TaxID=1712513 RepID=A0A4P9YYR7_9FUNG|nr:ATP dependent DNA ligase domain-containing protein [Syncephalis pseudoplumigaleata]|eukprot:RKP25204.1 ATP dependent DNA ligase domain-containing protein [Syncephalis pseudoplumigaleata]